MLLVKAVKLDLSFEIREKPHFKDYYLEEKKIIGKKGDWCICCNSSLRFKAALDLLHLFTDFSKDLRAHVNVCKSR